MRGVNPFFRPEKDGEFRPVLIDWGVLIFGGIFTFYFSCLSCNWFLQNACIYLLRALGGTVPVVLGKQDVINYGF